MDQLSTPLYDALMTHIGKKPISYHVPGHKNGLVFNTKADPLFRQILKMDATELTGLDDLHSPEDAILEAQSLLADLYKTERSFFLVNGSTSGNLTMVLSACRPDSIVLVQRNCHKSVMNALMLAKVQPVFLEPEYDAEWNIAGGVAVETILEALKQYPDSSAIVLTYPSYYGNVYNLKSIIQAAHQHGVAVLVDEAHGPHFIIGDPFPASAVHLGADMVVHSAHKTLPAMTMGSYLHFNSTLIKIEKVLDFLQIFQSSSPSYPIMASLDLARSYLGTYDSEDLCYLKEELSEFKRHLAGIPALKVLEYNREGDPLKLTIQSASGLSGYALQKRLEEAGVFTELADPLNVLMVLPLLKKKIPYPFEDTIQRIKQSLTGTFSATAANKVVFNKNKPISALAISYKEMEKKQSIEVSIESAAGKAAAESIIPYPPGIPLLLKGEEITEEKINLLRYYLEAGSRFQGGSLLEKGILKVYVIG